MPNKIKPWKVIKSKVIHKTSWNEIIEDTCLSNHTEFKYTYTKRIDEGPIIIPLENDGSIWLVRQYRHPIKKIIWQLPAEGKLSNESWIDAAKRGLKEELQLEAKQWVNLGQYFNDPGGLEQKYQLYLATDFVQNHEISTVMNNDDTEILQIKNFSRAEIDKMIESGDICDNWTLAGLYLLDRYRAANKFF
jgi:ADP-ribose pyrophosphatase